MSIFIFKDIERGCEQIKDVLLKKHVDLGPQPWTKNQLSEWERTLCSLKTSEVLNLNKSIDKYNLVVPMLRGQMFHFQLEKEVKKVIENFKKGKVREKKSESQPKITTEIVTSKKDSSLLNTIISILYNTISKSKRKNT